MTASPVTRLDTSVDSKARCAQYDVYFNGVLQHDCVVADVTGGYVVKWLKYMGAVVSRNGQPVTKRLHGRVVIVPKGETP